MRVVLLPALLAGSCFGQTFGTWKMNAARSTPPGETQPKSLTVRIEPHPKGEVFTLDRGETDGRSTTFSTVLYLDNIARDFDGFECSGTLSSRRIDNETVEVVRKCESAQWTKFVRRTSTQPNELVLTITEQRPNGRRVERRLVLEKQ